MAMSSVDLPPTHTNSTRISEAYEYLNLVFMNDRKVYESFLKVLGEFKQQNLERMEVIEQVAELFAGHHQLLKGFNQFLPRGYRLEPSDDPLNLDGVVIITPEGRLFVSNSKA